MRRWSIRWSLGLVIVALAAVGLTLLWPTDPRPCRSTFDRVGVGMTRADVYAVVGGPPGDYRADGRSCNPDNLFQWDWLPNPEVWWADDAFLQATFGPDGRVADVYIGEMRVLPGDPPRPWRRALARLGL